jgi:CubicO group peptidase (beta-lactamase class C family)
MDDILSSLLNQGIQTGVFPGAVAAVSVGNSSERTVFISSAGIKDNQDSTEKITEDTFFDLASLSKALSTTLCIYQLVDERKIQFSDTLEVYFSDICFDKKQITIQQLLSHSSGLPAYHPYFKKFKPRVQQGNRETLLQLIVDEDLVYRGGTQCAYSDLGYILLGCIVEKVTGKPLDTVFQELIAAPLGVADDILYLPLHEQILDPQRVAATENCPWRNRILRGEVHDEHCWLMGGVSGHAGLFGRGEGVLKLCGEILDMYTGCDARLAFQKTLQKGLQREYNHSTWCLGFDAPSKEGSSGGDFLSAASRGHLGYAGTSFWIDPEKKLVMVLLTNRVHPSRDNNKIRHFRPYFHNRVIEELGLKWTV